jgi:hypothetical protein
LIHLEPLSWVGGPIILLDSQRLEVQGPTHPLQVVGKGLDSCIVPSLGRTLSMRLVIIGITVVIVPPFTSLQFKSLALLTQVFDLVMCIFAADDVAQVLVIPVTHSVVFLRCKETASRVPTWTMSVVKLTSPCFVITVECRVNHGCYIQHRLEALHVCVNFFVVLW